MKVGKTILGFDALEIIARTSNDSAGLKTLLANLAMEEVEKAKARLAVESGITFRAMFVEEMDFAGRPSLTGYLLDYKAGPAVPVDDPSMYHYAHYFIELDASGAYVQLYRIDNYPDEEQ